MELITDERKNDFYAYGDIKKLAGEVKDVDKLNSALEKAEFASATKMAINTLIWPYPLWNLGNLYVTVSLGLDVRLGKEAGSIVGGLINKLMICIYVFGLFKAIFYPVLSPAIYLILPLCVSMWYTFTTTLVNSRLMVLIVKQQIIEEIKNEETAETKDETTESQN